MDTQGHAAQLGTREVAALVREDSFHKSLYTDPELFDLEMRNIYGRAWIYVGHESQVPEVGNYHATRLGDQDVIMVRGTDRKINVLYNRCAHKGLKLVHDGSGSTGKFFRCPYHAWTFKLDGSHLSAPLRNAYQGTCFDPKHPDFSLRSVARVDSYRGFVFARQSDTGPELREFLGGAISFIDNMCDRAPEGEVEVAGGVFRVLMRSNWKMMYENVIDSMHPLATHESTFNAARQKAEELNARPLELNIMASLGAPYEFWEQLELKAYDNGHGSMQDIFGGGNLAEDPVASALYEALSQVHGPDRAQQIMDTNIHNSVLYGSGMLQTTYQQFRVLRPLSVDRTLLEVYVFRLKGAPKEVFRRAISFANVSFSPASNVMPDDVDFYRRCQEGNMADGGDWINLHRYAGQDREERGARIAATGTSELLMRNQYQAWKSFMSPQAS